jgi:Chitinase class I
MNRILKIGCALALAPMMIGATVDRPAFFESCKTLTNYDMDPTGKIIPRGNFNLKPNQIQSIDLIIDTWESQNDNELKRLAYIIATARRETINTFEPIREAPKCRTEECREKVIGELLKRRAEKKSRPVPENYAKKAENGQRYYGRGFVQMTHDYNYREADKRLVTGNLLYNSPDKALDKEIATKILVRSILEGWFGNRKPLSQYLNENESNWDKARDNVSPNSPNKSITAAYAQEFYGCLKFK